VEDELLLIVPPKHRLAARKAFRWKELAGQPLVMFEGQSAVRDLIERQLARAGVEPVVVMELRSIDAILQMVQQGIGAGFVSRWALVGSRFAAFASGLGKRHAGLRSADQRLVRTLAIVSRADRAPTAAASAFVDLMQRLGAT
jgi:DNA-binding transcriptional LysR family regulator